MGFLSMIRGLAEAPYPCTVWGYGLSNLPIPIAKNPFHGKPLSFPFPYIHSHNPSEGGSYQHERVKPTKLNPKPISDVLNKVQGSELGF